MYAIDFELCRFWAQGKSEWYSRPLIIYNIYLI